MFKLTDSQKLWLKQEAVSILHTFLAFAIIDGGTVLSQVYNGNWDRMLLWQLCIILARSLVKALLTAIFPGLKPTSP